MEQKAPGRGPAPALVESFDGLGVGFQGPQGPGRGRNPSDNTLAVGPDHIVPIVNSRMAIFTRKGKKFRDTGRALYGAVPTNNVFRGFGGACAERNNGDAVVRYDQLADRWLIVMPIFSRLPYRADQPAGTRPGDPAAVSMPAVAGQPGHAAALFQPQTMTDTTPPQRRGPGGEGERPQEPQGVYAMCYAVSTSPDPLGSYYRYEFLRPYFPDYPRPAVWPDGYYVPTSTSDNRISETVATQKHACVAERAKMLKGEPASEQCVIVENVNFLNNADLEGKELPPAGAPNIMLAAGGRQLDSIFQDSVINAWKFHVDWKDPSKTRVIGPEPIRVAPYHYLCDGQLTNCVPQPGTDRRLDAQGDKIMARVVYRRIGDQESVVAAHSVNTSASGGGVRWYEFRVGKDRDLELHQQGTYLADGLYRWMGSPAIDRRGNIGIGYSFGGPDHFPGQRFAGRRPTDPPGELSLAETVLVEGEAAQTNTLRWEDYTQTAVDPADDCTIWYVGDYLKKDATAYSTRIGAFRMPGCGR
ncbi:MAG TPA: hypothetical protein VFQ38_06285 [Longimicrobiales bacterium]|nr:hypothetical protein [Longimicrobiales bacterium]